MATLGSRQPFVTIRTMRVSGYCEFEHSGGAWLQIYVGIASYRVSACVL